MTLQQGFGFEPRWTWYYDTELKKGAIVNPNNQVVAMISKDGEHIYKGCRNITHHEDCMARGIARINLGADISLSPQSTTQQE